MELQFSYTRLNHGARWKLVGNITPSVSLPVRNNPGTPRIERSVGLRASLHVSEKENTSWSRQDFFVFSCTLFVLHPYLVLCLDCPAFCLLSVLAAYTTHNTNIHAPGGIIFFLVLCTSSLLGSLIVLHFASSLTTHNTNIHAPVGFEPTTPSSDQPQSLA